MLGLWIYNFFLILALIIASPVLAIWMWRVPKIRAGFWQKWGGLPDSFYVALERLPLEKRIWLHAVSVGELNAAQPLIDALRAEGFHLLLSTTTATGYQLAEKNYPTLPRFYFPFDLPGVIQNQLRLLKPKAIILMETEIWPNLLFAAYQRAIPVVMVNGRLSTQSFKGYSRIRLLLKPVLSRYARFLMQSETDANRIIALGADVAHVTATGNLKFVASTDPINPKERAVFERLSDSPTVVLASAHPGEEAAFLAVFAQLKQDFPTLKAVIAPRHPERFVEVGQLLTQSSFSVLFRSGFLLDTPLTWQDHEILLLDSIGELKTILAFATVAVMGGSFGTRGGQNPLEALHAHIPVVFGPHMENFEAVASEIIRHRAGFQVDSLEAIQPILTGLLSQAEVYQAAVLAGSTLLRQYDQTLPTTLTAIHEVILPPA